MVVLEVIFLLSKNLIDPSVVKVSLLFFIWKIFVFFVSFYLFLHLFCNRKEIYGVKTNNMTSNYLSEEYLMNTVARF